MAPPAPKPDLSKVTSVPVQSAPLPQPAIPQPDQNKQFKALKPFLDLGKEIATGKNSWA